MPRSCTGVYRGKPRASPAQAAVVGAQELHPEASHRQPSEAPCDVQERPCQELSAGGRGVSPCGMPWVRRAGRPVLGVVQVVVHGPSGGECQAQGSMAGTRVDEEQQGGNSLPG